MHKKLYDTKMKVDLYQGSIQLYIDVSQENLKCDKKGKKSKLFLPFFFDIYI